MSEEIEVSCFKLLNHPDDNGNVMKEMGTRKEKLLHTDRHTIICNLCGIKSYPECREWCSNG